MVNVSDVLSEILTVAATPKEVINRVKGEPSVNFDESLLYEDIGEGKLLIDYLIENAYFHAIKHNVNSDLRILDYCVALNRFDFLSTVILNKLFEERDGSFLAEKYLNNSEFIGIIANHTIADDVVIKLYNKGYKKIAINAKESVLLSTCSSGTTILEDMLKFGISPTFFEYEFNSTVILKILYDNNRPDLMYNTKLDLLFSSKIPNSKKNYLQYMIDCYKKGIDVHFERINYVSNNKELLARCYILMAKNGLVVFLNDLSEDDMVSHNDGEKSLLYYLIKIDKRTTINRILSFDLERSRKVLIELRMLDVDEGLLDISFDRFNCANMCREIYNSKYDKDCISQVEDLLFKLRNLFLKDGYSNIDLIDALIKSYRYNTVDGANPLFIEELKLLIAVKEQHPNFYYIMKLNAGVFVEERGVIEVEDTTIETLIHETGHALHWYLTSYEVPEDFDDLLSRINAEDDWLDRVNTFAIKYNEIDEDIYSLSENIISMFIVDSDDYVSNVNELLLHEKSEIFQFYMARGYSKETLEVVLSDIFTFEEFMLQKGDIELEQVNETIKRYTYDGFLAIGDIIDAVVGGKLDSGLLYSKNGKIISPIPGHGIRYYSGNSEDDNIKNRFCEMVANYSTIIKSKNSNDMIKLLRGIVGDELVDMLDDFYKTRILQLPDTRNRVVR